MKFDANQYVPILKLKRGEKEALPRLSPSVRERITPVFEVVVRETDKKTPTEHLDTAFKGFKATTDSIKRYFLDCREVENDGPDVAEEIFRRAAELGTPFVPVTGMSRSADVQAALKHRASGLALRLTRDEFERGLVNRELLPFVKYLGVPRDVIDLIVDLGPVDDMVLPGVQGLAASFLADIPDVTSWRTLTTSASAFPPGMGGLDSRSHDVIDRTDWLSWREGIRFDTSLARIPTFSDGVIQHPSGVEGIDFRIRPVAASIRYTSGDKWLRLKGVSMRAEPGAEQFQELATTLVHGYLSKYFAGASHCDGCLDMWSAADGADNFGSHFVWRRLGAIHHITTTVEQLDVLVAP